MGAGGPRPDLTSLLVACSAGRIDGRDRLVEAVQGELRRIAAAYMRRERPDHRPTAATPDPRQAEIVELRSFGGLTEEEVATVMHLSPPTIRREIAARFWLGHRMQGAR